MLFRSVSVFVTFTSMFVFAVLARFENTIFKTIKNAFVMSVLQFPKTILMIILYLLPIILFAISMRLIPIAFLFGLSVPVYLSAMLYNKFFKKLETQILEAVGPIPEEDDSEKIFNDKLDDALMDKNQY